MAKKKKSSKKKTSKKKKQTKGKKLIKGKKVPTEKRRKEEEQQGNFDPSDRVSTNGAKAKQTSSLTLFLKRVRSFSPIGVLLFVLYNTFWENIGSYEKAQLLYVVIIYTVFFYRNIIWRFSRKYVYYKFVVKIIKIRAGKKEVFKNRLSVAFIIILILLTGLFSTQAAFAAFRVFWQSDQEKFWTRIDHIIQKSLDFYDSTYLPSWLCSSLMKGYYPQVRDTGRKYHTIDGELFHIRKCGIAKYTLTGDCYKDADPYVYFICQCEAESKNHERLVCARSYPDKKPIELDFVSKSCPGEDHTSNLVRIKQPVGKFGYTRYFCGPDGMKREYEGFIVDFRNIVHPPNEINITFITDHKIRNFEIHSVTKRANLIKLVTSAPWYENEFIKEPEEVTNREQVKAYLDEIRKEKRLRDFKGPIYVWNAKIPCKSVENLFVLSYIVNKE